MSNSADEQFLLAMNKHKGIIYKVVNSYCQNKEDRPDLAQEILTTLWLSMDKYDDEYKFSTWMYRIALNVAISYFRKNKTRQDKVHEGRENLITIDELTADEDNSEDRVLLYQFIGELDSLNKAIILLYLENESHDSIANNLGISKTNVATRVNRVKLQLAKKFNN